MIEQGNGPDLPEEEKPKNKKRKRRGFLSSWLEAREVKPDGEAEEQVEQKGKGLNALWKRLFERNVSLETVEEAATEEEQRFSDDVLTWWPGISRPEQTEEVDEQKDEVVMPQAKPAEFEGTVDLIEESATSEEIPTIETADYPLPGQAELEEQVQALQNNRTELPDRDSPTVSARGTKSEKLETKVADSKREPLAAVTLVGLGAEYLTRKRRDREHDKKITDLERKTEAHAKRYDDLTAEKPIRPVFAEAKISREKQQIPLKKEVKQEAKPTIDKATFKKRESDNKKLAEQVAKNVELYEKQQEAPISVLAEMVKAAEVDAPVERIYERRQEVRDESSSRFSSTVPIAAVIRNITPPAHPPGIYEIEDSSVSHQSYYSGSTDLYKQAAQRGFWGAIVIVIFMLIVYLLI